MVDGPKWTAASTIFAWTTIGLSLLANQVAGQPSEEEIKERVDFRIERFELFNNCKPM